MRTRIHWAGCWVVSWLASCGSSYHYTLHILMAMVHGCWSRRVKEGVVCILPPLLFTTHFLQWKKYDYSFSKRLREWIFCRWGNLSLDTTSILHATKETISSGWCLFQKVRHVLPHFPPYSPPISSLIKRREWEHIIINVHTFSLSIPKNHKDHGVEKSAEKDQ